MIRLGVSIPAGAAVPPFRLSCGGRLFERVTLDGGFVTLDGLPVYMEI